MNDVEKSLFNKVYIENFVDWWQVMIMQTKIWTVDKNVDNNKNYPHVIEAAQKLKAGELIAFPTETVYGLGANALISESVAGIYQAKGRPSDNPLIVHIGDKGQLHGLVAEIPEVANTLIEKFWPGPLTLIFQKKEGLFPDVVTAGLSTVAIRMPDHPVALDLLKEAGCPTAAPSANLSGKPSPTTAEHVYEDLAGKIAGIVDGGPTGVGLESTVLDVTGKIPQILRPGGITKEQLEEVIGKVEVDPGLTKESDAPKAPGMKYKHYAPKAPLTLVDGTPQFIQTLINKERALGKKVGVYTVSEHAHLYDADVIIAGGSREELSSVAEKMYGVLRQFDKEQPDLIFGEVFLEDGIGQAIMNRLKKAAGGRIITQDEF